MKKRSDHETETQNQPLLKLSFSSISCWCSMIGYFQNSDEIALFDIAKISFAELCLSSTKDTWSTEFTKCLTKRSVIYHLLTLSVSFIIIIILYCYH